MRYSWTIAVAVLLSAVALTPVGNAQAAEGTLFFTDEIVSESGIAPAAQDVCGSKVYAMTPDAPTEAAGQKAAAAPSYAASGCATEFTYTMPAATTLDGDATLQFFTSCDQAFVGYPAGISSYRGHLLHNGEEISQATIFGGSGPCVLGDVEEHTMTLGTDDAEIAAGDTLTIRIFWWTTNPQGAATTNAHYLVYGTDTPSGLTAAGLVAGNDGPATIEDSLDEGDAADVSLALNETTNATYVYQWNATLQGPSEISYNVSVSSGEAVLSVRDGANATLMDLVVAGNESDVVVSESAAAGPWTISVALTDAVGTVDISIGAHLEATPADASPEPTPTTDGNQTAGNGTANDADDANGIPGFEAPLAAVGAVLAAFVLARRGRRDR